jgi:hypothetical protein
VRLIVRPTLEAVTEANKIVCEAGENPHQCLDTGKIESAIASAFYPGPYPFAHGGLASCFAGVSGGLAANLLLSTADPLLSGISQEAARILDKNYIVTPVSNWYFMASSWPLRDHGC